MDSATTVIAIFLAAILMFIFPLMTMANEKDNISQLEIKNATEEFINKITTTGKLTMEEYDNFILTLASTGNSYDVEITIQRLDENSGKKENGVTVTIGNNVYYTQYTTQVLNDLVNDSMVITKEGDIVSVDVKNTNVTIAEQLRSWLTKVRGNASSNIAASASGMVTTTGN